MMVGVRSGSDEKSRGDACSFSITVSPSASTKREEASDMSDEIEEKREEDLFGELLIFNIARCFKQGIPSHYGAGRQYLFIVIIIIFITSPVVVYYLCNLSPIVASPFNTTRR